MSETKTHKVMAATPPTPAKRRHKGTPTGTRAPRADRPTPIPSDAEEYAEDQRRRHEVLAGILAEAQALTPDPPDSPARRAAREDPVGEIVAEKMRRQGFHL